MILSEDQHTVLELLRVHLIQDDESNILSLNDNTLEIIEEILISDEI